MELGLTPEQAATKKFFYGKGCDKCNNTGYKGRMGIYELLVMNDTLREMVVAEASLDEFRNACRKFGMKTLREVGMEVDPRRADLHRGDHAGNDAGRFMIVFSFQSLGFQLSSRSSVSQRSVRKRSLIEH